MPKKSRKDPVREGLEQAFLAGDWFRGSVFLLFKSVKVVGTTACGYGSKAWH
jgi:hypothetical protein